MAAASALPAFVVLPDVQYPVLPQGIHEANMATVEKQLVAAFTPEAQRRTVFDGWRAFRNLLRAIVPVRAEYLDGSFVTEKPNPKDIDVSFWVAADDLAALPTLKQVALNDLMARASSFNVDGYIVPECDPGHPASAQFTFMLWTEHFWSRCRDSKGLLLPPHTVRKGYVRVVQP